MVHQGFWNHQSLTISVKGNCLTISLGSREVFSYDLAGRLWTALVDEISYRRGLDGKIVAKWQTGEKTRQRRWLTPPESADLIERGHALLCKLTSDLRSQKIVLNPPLNDIYKPLPPSTTPTLKPMHSAISGFTNRSAFFHPINISRLFYRQPKAAPLIPAPFAISTAIVLSE